MTFASEDASTQAMHYKAMSLAALILAVALSACSPSAGDHGVVVAAETERTTALRVREQNLGQTGLAVEASPTDRTVGAVRHLSTGHQGHSIGPQPTTRNAPAKWGRATSQSYVIGPGDVLDISVFRVPELSRSIQVTSIGTINMPLIGDIPAANETPENLEKRLAEKLGEKYLENPQVQVYVKDYRSQRITVEGAVRNPGTLALEGETTLLQTIAQAGGLSELSDETNVVIFRQTGARRTAARFDMISIREGRSNDPKLVAGDIVVVHKSIAKQMFENLVKVLPVARVFVPVP